MFVRYPFSYFWLETGSYELIFVHSRASKQSYIETIYVVRTGETFIQFVHRRAFGSIPPSPVLWEWRKCIKGQSFSIVLPTTSNWYLILDGLELRPGARHWYTPDRLGRRYGGCSGMRLVAGFEKENTSTFCFWNHTLPLVSERVRLTMAWPLPTIWAHVGRKK